MARQVNVRTWTCDRDDSDPAAPFVAVLRIGDQVIASGRGVDEVAAYTAFVDALDAQGVSDGNVLRMQDLMRRRNIA